MRSLNELVKESSIKVVLDENTGEEFAATEESLRKFRKLILEDVGRAVEVIIDSTIPGNEKERVLAYSRALKKGF